MREIKFRYRVDQGYFRGDRVIATFIFTIDQIEERNGEYNAVLENYKIVSRNLFTGLKDKNGKEIYEGDIVRNHWYRINGDYLGHDWVVKFGEHMTSGDYYNCDAYGWYVEGINPEADEPEHTLHDLPADGDKGVEVIGNIYENPELL